MRRIHKPAKEPEFFAQWKEKLRKAGLEPGWGELDGKPVKQDVKRSLLQEQGYLCCYCEVRVDEEHGHIEHIQPRHSHSELDDVVYTNMLYSCKETPKNQPTTCGHARKPHDLVPVSPLSEDCESRFLYTEDGWMLSRVESDTDASETARILNLNEVTLRVSRAAVYEEVVDTFENLSGEEFHQWIAKERQRDESERFSPFLGTKSYIADVMEATGAP